MKHQPTGIIEKILSLAVTGIFFYCIYRFSLMVHYRGGRSVGVFPFVIPPLLLIWAPAMIAEFIFKNQSEKAIRRWGWTILLFVTVPSIIVVSLLRWP